MYDRTAIHEQCLQAKARARQVIADANSMREHASANLAKAMDGLAHMHAGLTESERRMVEAARQSRGQGPSAP